MTTLVMDPVLEIPEKTGNLIRRWATTPGGGCYRKLTKGRAAVEREFGRLKDGWKLGPLRVRRLERVQLHADLTMLAKLSCALALARAVPLAA